MRDYYFDEIISRRHTNSYKWDKATDDGVLPLWVADMDFRTAPCIIEALQDRVDHGIFGYTKVPDEYYDALISWFANRHGWKINREDVIYTTSVVAALSAIIKGLSEPGSKVIVQTPAYNCFFSSIHNNGCLTAANELLYDSVSGRYTMDFDGLEQMAADPDTSLMILCNPHNPAGRVWREEELERVAEICRDHNVTVVADEIHCELILGEHRYIPFANVAQRVGCRYVVTNSPSKAFNTAGLQIANIVAPDEELRRRIDRAINDNEVCDVNPFGVVGLIAAYKDGGEWLEALLRYLYGNYLYARERLRAQLPRFTVSPLEGTYLLWINISATGMDSKSVCDILEQKAHVMLNPGDMYGKGGDSFVRLNLACPRRVLVQALDMLIPVLEQLAE